MNRKDITNAYAFSLANDCDSSSQVLTFMYDAALEKLDNISLALCQTCVYNGQQGVSPVCKGCGSEELIHRNYKCNVKSH